MKNKKRNYHGFVLVLSLFGVVFFACFFGCLGFVFDIEVFGAVSTIDTIGISAFIVSMFVAVLFCKSLRVAYEGRRRTLVSLAPLD